MPNKQIEDAVAEYAKARRREYNRRYRERNHTRILEYQRDYYARHRDRCNARQREYYRKNKGKILEYQRARRNRKKAEKKPPGSGNSVGGKRKINK